VITPRFAKRKAKGNLRQLAACILLATASLLISSATAAGESFPVTKTADSGAASLRAAIEAANQNAGPDSIPIDATGAIELQTPLPVIEDDIEIAGPGQDALTVRRDVAGDFTLTVRRDVAGDFRVFEAGAVAVSLSGITVANGRAAAGGGILSQGRLTLTEVTVSGNEAVASGEPEAIAQGAGILSFGPLTMRQSTVSENTVLTSEGGFQTSALAGGVAAFGGALIDRSTVSGNTARAEGADVSEFVLAEGAGLLLAGGNLNRVQRSTVSDNSTTSSGGTASTNAFGGGIEGEGLAITSSTISGNSASPKPMGGVNLDLSVKAVVRTTIVSNPLGGGVSCGQELISEGFNIDEGSSCGFTGPTDRSGVDPGLDPNLAANGGPTLTHALLPGSVAIDAGSAFGAGADQRGLPRPSDFPAIANAPGGDGSDIGAFEVQAPPSPGLVGGGMLVPGTADVIPPDTQIDREPPNLTRKRFARFRFSSTDPGSRFECSTDAAPFTPCSTPLRRRVRRGARHLFRVRSIDPAGNVDPMPARCVWRVKRPQPPAGRGR
jgi:hypothetical protein